MFSEIVIWSVEPELKKSAKTSETKEVIWAELNVGRVVVFHKVARCVEHSSLTREASDTYLSRLPIASSMLQLLDRQCKGSSLLGPLKAQGRGCRPYLRRDARKQRVPLALSMLIATAT